MSEIRGVAKTYQAINEAVQKLRETSNTMISQTLERTTQVYERKVDNTYWQAGSSGLSLGAAGVLGILGAASESDIMEAVSKVSAKAGDIFNTVLHGDDIRADSQIKKEDHTLSMTKELERQASQLDEQLGRELSQLMQQENDEFRLR